MKRVAIGLLVLISAMALTGCGTTGESVVYSGYAERNIKAVAVVDVVGLIEGETAKNQVADFFTMEFMRRGYRVIERFRAIPLMKEQDKSLPSAPYEEKAVYVGRLLEVDGVLLVNIPKLKEGINMTAKLVDVDDGTILWQGRGSGSTGRTAWTILGGVAGAAAGSQIGSGRTARTAGAVGGGVVGGTLGYALSPSQESKLKAIVDEMCEDLPPAPLP